MCADEDEEECDLIRDRLETIDHVVDDYGIVLVATHNLEVAKENKIKRFPALGLFKNGEFVRFEGDLAQEISVLRWLTSPATQDIPQRIEEVNEVMLAKRLKTEDSMFVFFYEDEDIFAARLLKGLEELDDGLDKKGVVFLKISDAGIDRDYSLETLPALVHFSQGEQEVYQGDLR